MTSLTPPGAAEDLVIVETAQGRVRGRRNAGVSVFKGMRYATDTGGACSATAIRALIKQLIAAEDGKKPLSDSQISEILGQQGIVVARRTVAKYRESLNIPPVNLRKTL